LFTLADWIGIEASVLRGDDACRAAGAIGWPGVELIVGGQVVADGEVIRRAGLRHQQRRKDNAPGPCVAVDEYEPLPVAEAGAAVIEPRILRRGGKGIDALRIAFGLIQHVSAVDHQVLELNTGREDELILAVESARLELVVVDAGVAPVTVYVEGSNAGAFTLL